jgi:KUP system potassium uptake protein
MNTNTQNSPRNVPSLLALTLGSIGVVYGDIGTSPLYAFRESLAAAEGSGEPHMAVLGILSLILWSLMLIVTLKYVFLVLRADNHGEGGILSLMALAENAAQGKLAKRSGFILMLGIAGAALFYGDAVITPAISVLSAVEGLNLVTHHFTPYVIPIALIILIALFIMQQSGTKKVSQFFAPIMVVWFIVLALGGLNHITDTPQVMLALNPWYGFYFLTHHGFISFITLGAIFLSITGAEALYADLGHFGKKPIRIAWLYVIMPALLLNYFGQGALVLANPEAAENPFFLLYPDWALMPMVILSAMATVIASQAVISGAFSLTHQAIQLRLLPRLFVEYTSAFHVGQIYIPKINWLLLGGVVLLIALFRTSSNLAAAYGIAVTGDMVITTILVFIVMRYKWRWSLPLALVITIPMVCIDLTFLAANLIKFIQGGFVPLLLSSILILMMYTWCRGSSALHSQARGDDYTMETLIHELNHYPPQRVEGTAIYLTSNIHYAPSALIQNLRHNKVLHMHNYVLTLRFDTKPYVPEEERIVTQCLNKDFTRIFMNFGYMDTPNVTQALQLLPQHGIRLNMESTTFFISRRNIMPSAHFGMPLWQDYIFIALSSGASDAAAFFHLPPSCVVELGVQMTV